VPPCRINCHYTAFTVSWQVVSPPCIPTVATRLPNELTVSTLHATHCPPSNWPPPHTASNLLHHCHQLSLATLSIMATKFIFNHVACLLSWSFYDHARQVHLHTCSINTFKFAWSLPSSAFSNSRNCCFQVHLKVLYDYGLQVYLSLPFTIIIRCKVNSSQAPLEFRHNIQCWWILIWIHWYIDGNSSWIQEF